MPGWLQSEPAASFNRNQWLQSSEGAACAESADQALKRGKFTETAVGFVHIDISELRLAFGKLNMFLAIDRVSKFTYVEFRDDVGKMNGADFLRSIVSAFP